MFTAPSYTTRGKPLSEEGEEGVLFLLFAKKPLKKRVKSKVPSLSQPYPENIFIGCAQRGGHWGFLGDRYTIIALPCHCPELQLDKRGCREATSDISQTR